MMMLILVNLWWGREFWGHLVVDDSKRGAVFGEVVAAEWSVEQAYKNIIESKNPFTWRDDGLYPLGQSFATGDVGNALYFVFLRPFLSVHQAMMVTVGITSLLAGLGMYLLLREKKVPPFIAFPLSIMFSYPTFLLPRMGHLTYFSHYVFPWFFWFSARVCAEHGKDRLIGTTGMAVTLALALFHNLYYFVILGTAVFFAVCYRFITHKGEFWGGLRKNILYYLGTLGVFFLLILPWGKEIVLTSKIDGPPDTVGWGGAIGYSADLLGVFVPSIYSKYMSPFANFLGTRFDFARGVFENYVYPGILPLIVGGYAVITALRGHGKAPIWKEAGQWLFASLSLWIMTLGPFLHVAGKWTLSVAENILVVVPLPFALFHYLPFMDNIRSPGRFAMGMIFTMYIAIGIVLRNLFARRVTGVKLGVFGGLMLIFVVDHTIQYTKPEDSPIPDEIVEIVKTDNSKASVLQLPSFVRDGFIYFGAPESIDFLRYQFLYDKPVLGGYFGRVPGYKIKYYQNNPLLGYLGRISDPNVALNGGLDRTSLPEWTAPKIENSAMSADFLSIGYAIVKDEEEFTASASSLLTDIGFVKTHAVSQGYSLWERQTFSSSFLKTSASDSSSSYMMAGEWYDPDQGGFRWMKRRGHLLFRVGDEDISRLKLRLSSVVDGITVEIYLNREKISAIRMKEREQTFVVDSLPQYIRKNDINIVSLVASKAVKPHEIDESNPDTNEVSVRFFEAELE